MRDKIVLEQFDIAKSYSNIKTFDCGNELINKIPQSLNKQVKDGNIASYVLIDLQHSQEDFIIGFYTISSFAIAKSEFDTGLANLPTSIPCLRLIMLGIDRKYQGQKLSLKLMAHALRLTLKQSESIGVRGLYLDAADGKHEFYAKLGFKAIRAANEHNILPMFLSIQAIQNSLTGR